MPQKLEIYKSNLCGNIVEVVTGGAGALVCCGQDMVLMEENTVDAAQEKHVPVPTRDNGGWEVTVGSGAPPMAEKHWIEWIEEVRLLSETETPIFVAQFAIASKEER